MFDKGGVERVLQTAMINLALCAFLSGCNQEHAATATTQDGSAFTMTLTAKASLQSDWNRMLAIGHDGETISVALLEDTGWWRGSNLYLSNEGFYVLNEGQMGCFAFFSSPPKALKIWVDACDHPLTTPLERGAASKALQGYPASRFYPDLFYVGSFNEGVRDVAIVFKNYAEAPEIRLPDPL